MWVGLVLCPNPIEELLEGGYLDSEEPYKAKDAVGIQKDYIKHQVTILPAEADGPNRNRSLYSIVCSDSYRMKITNRVVRSSVWR